MSLASPVGPNWLYDFGEFTGADLDEQSATIDDQIASAREAAVAMIATGNYGPDDGTYRVTVRADSTSAGFTVEIRQVTG